MPLFDFRCPKCGKHHEKVCQRDSITAQCPDCDVESVRLWTSPTAWVRKDWHDLMRSEFANQESPYNVGNGRR